MCLVENLARHVQQIVKPLAEELKTLRTQPSCKRSIDFYDHAVSCEGDVATRGILVEVVQILHGALQPSLRPSLTQRL